MVTTSGEKIEETTIIIPDGVKKTIASIKEIVGDHYSDADVYVTLKECSMDPNESVQKLLHQDTFHEVKRRKNKKKEVESLQPQKKLENEDERTRPRAYPYRTHQRAPFPRNAVAGNATYSESNTSNPDTGNATYTGRSTSNLDAGNAAYTGRTTSDPDAGKAAYTGRTKSNPDAGKEASSGGNTSNPDAGKEASSGGNTSNPVAGNAAYLGRNTSNPAAAGRGKVIPGERTRVLPAAGRIKEFRVVRDNRANQIVSKEIKPNPQQGSTPRSEPTTSKPAEMSSRETSNSQNSLGGKTISQAPNRVTNLHVRPASDTSSRGNVAKDLSAGQTIVSNTVVHGITVKSNISQTQPTRPSSSNSVVGVYSSSLDPVHVPSLGSRSSTAVGAIRREVGVVGVRKQSSQAVKHSSTPVSSLPNPITKKDKSSSPEVPELSSTIPKSNQLKQIASHDSSTQNVSRSKPLLTNHHGSRSSHQAMGNKKAFKPIKEWKPKPNKKSDDIAPGVIGSPAKSALPSADIPADYSTESKNEAVKMQDNPSRLNIYDNQNVVIADHLRVAETDRCLLTFGSIVPGFEPVGSAEASTRDSSPSVSAPVQTSSYSDISASREVNKQEDAATNPHLHPAASAAADENPVHSSSPHNLDSYADIGIVHENKHFYASFEPQQVPEATEMPSFTAYDPPTGYDMPYYRPTMDVSSQGHGLPSPQEDLTSYMANNMPPSTIAVMPQQPPLGQMYPQAHLSQYPNMPYRQFISPVYAPQMAMPGYSSPAYPHQSNGGNYMVMPGGNSHPNMSSLKYGIQQFKPLPNAAPTGFGNYTAPSGYAMNASGVVGGAIGIEDSSRLKYKDGNLYVPNPQAETSEMWMQNPRDLQGMQSAQYYNMTAQQTPHGAYLPSHGGHTQFSPPGMYHPQQQPGLASPHHLAPGMGSNLAGIGMPAPVPRAQVVGYQQQPQLNHLNWIPNL